MIQWLKQNWLKLNADKAEVALAGKADVIEGLDSPVLDEMELDFAE